MAIAKMGTTDKATRTFKTGLLLWHGGATRPAEQRRIAQLLEKPINSRLFESLPIPTLPSSTEDCVGWIRRHDEPRPFFLFVPRFPPYKVEDRYLQAKTESDGQYSPHTALRTLRGRDILGTLDFVNEFGPLELLDESDLRKSLALEDLLEQDEIVPGEEATAARARCLWIDINDFWQKQLRFAAVVELW